MTVVDVAIFRTGKAGVLNKWLMNWINSPVVRAYIDVNSSGTTRKRISKGNLIAMELPVPPLPEQKRIADKLDATLARVDACRERLARVTPLLKRFRQSVLAAATSGQLTADWREKQGYSHLGIDNKELQGYTNVHNVGWSDEERPISAVHDESWAPTPDGWRQKELSELCHSITDGDHQAPPQAKTGIPFITISAINDGFLRLEKASRYVPIEYFEQLKDSRKPSRGDILFSVTGSICMPALVEKNTNFTFQRHIAILKTNTELISSKFLYFVLSSEDIKKQGLAVATGTAQLTVSLKGLRAFQIRLPSLNEQTEIVRRVETLFAFADRLEARLANASK
ncbi:restriction endonuclease subunit S, partial [Deefgea sp. CFH1-16]|uniref:restriction endonuclease subunit S n=1 Tax=Deefgea sp. CFH1-16 TaxID=2675457 RepID=UPI0015F6B70C